MNKNVVIFVLVVLTLVGSIWGSVANRKKINMEQKLNETVASMKKMAEQTSKEREQVLGKTAGLQENLVERDEQLAKARKELVSLRKETQGLEAKLSGCNASIAELKRDKETGRQELKAAQAEIASLKGKLDTMEKAQENPAVGIDTPPRAGDGEAALADSQSIQEQLQSAELTVDKLQQRLDAASAQIVGLEKIVDEKNDAMEETGREMDRLKINMDVLLSKIADQQDELQEIREENRELAKELTAKNEEIADLQEEVMQHPVQEQ